VLLERGILAQPNHHIFEKGVASMTSAHYKNELSRALLKLHDAQTAAAEWKQVAINRKTLLCSIDGAVTAQVYHAIKVGTLFGVSAHDPGLPEVDLSAHSAGEATSIVLRKLAFSSSFLAELCKEANQLQATLLSVLNIALESKDISRPLHDVDPESVDDLVAEAISPFHDSEDCNLWGESHGSPHQCSDDDALASGRIMEEHNVPLTKLALTTTSEAQRCSALDLFK